MKNRVNKNTWRLGETVVLPSTRAGRPCVLDEETLDYLQEAITSVRMDIGARLSIPMA